MDGKLLLAPNVLIRVFPLISRPDAQLPQSCAGGQGLYLRALEHLGKSSKDKDHKNIKKLKFDGWTVQ